ncbi:MAG: sulfite exporter TauE/SafE family protein [Candidatus Omnitrophota bacterium]
MLNITFSLFLTGLLFGSGPCLATCGPILVSYVVGTCKDIPKGLKDYLLFSLARIFVYLVLVQAVFFLGSFTLQRILGRYAQYLLILGGIFIAWIGVLMMLGKRPEFKFWQRVHKNIAGRDKQNLIGMGLVVGILPCAPLLAVLSYIGLTSKTWAHSLLYGVSFGLGTFLSPLIALVILAGFIPRVLMSRKAVYERVFSLICGFIIFFFGLRLIISAI